MLSFPRKLSLVETEEGYRLKHEFYPDLSYETLDGKSLEDSFVLEKLSTDGLKASTYVIN